MKKSVKIFLILALSGGAAIVAFWDSSFERHFVNAISRNVAAVHNQAIMHLPLTADCYVKKDVYGNLIDTCF